MHKILKVKVSNEIGRDKLQQDYKEHIKRKNRYKQVHLKKLSQQQELSSQYMSRHMSKATIPTVPSRVSLNQSGVADVMSDDAD